MQRGMSEQEFHQWRTEWFNRIPKCQDFCCCHELDSCCIERLCGCGSIYQTYKVQEFPVECDDVGCIDCVNRYECDKTDIINNALNELHDMLVVLS